MAEEKYETMRTLWYFDIDRVEADVDVVDGEYQITNFDPELPGADGKNLMMTHAWVFQKRVSDFLAEWIKSEASEELQAEISENGGRVTWNLPKGVADIDVSVEPRVERSLGI